MKITISIYITINEVTESFLWILLDVQQKGDNPKWMQNNKMRRWQETGRSPPDKVNGNGDL